MSITTSGDVTGTDNHDTMPWASPDGRHIISSSRGRPDGAADRDLYTWRIPTRAPPARGSHPVTRSLRRGVVAAVGVLALAGARQGTRLASGLARGTELVYESSGRSQAPWRVDSLRTGLRLRKGADCIDVQLRRAGQEAPDRQRLCLAADTLYRWIAERREWKVSRPVGRRMTWQSRQANGNVVRYETGDTASERISGRSIPVIHTTVTTTDSAGRPLRRLTERFALSLVTATGGVFEAPDSAARGGWRPLQTFELRSIR